MARRKQPKHGLEMMATMPKKVGRKPKKAKSAVTFPVRKPRAPRRGR